MRPVVLLFFFFLTTGFAIQDQQNLIPILEKLLDAIENTDKKDDAIFRLSSTDVPMRVDDGETAVIECPLSLNNPPQTVVWSKNDYEFLRFDNVSTEFKPTSIREDVLKYVNMDRTSPIQLVLKTDTLLDSIGVYKCEIVDADFNVLAYQRALNYGTHTAVLLPDKKKEHRFYPLSRPTQDLRKLRSGETLHLIHTINIDKDKLFRIFWIKDDELFLNYTLQSGFVFTPVRGIANFSEKLSTPEHIVLPNINSKTSGKFIYQMIDEFSDVGEYFMHEAKQPIEVSDCAINERQCFDGQCLPERFWCDYKKDCTIGDDERDCPPPPCATEELHCDLYKLGDTYCYKKEHKCDGHKDCADNSDEECRRSSSSNGGRWCQHDDVSYPEENNCDGVYHCRDHSDEDCGRGHIACEQDQFLCSDGRMCLSKEKINDHVDDCADFSDEVNNTDKIAYIVAEPLTPYLIDAGSTLYIKCRLDHFQNVTKVIWKKDGVFIAEFVKEFQALIRINSLPGVNIDLLDSNPFELSLRYVNVSSSGTYECLFHTTDGKSRNKENSFQRDIHIPKETLVKCSTEQFHCVGSNECVSSDLRCDDSEDCADGSDEEICPEFVMEKSVSNCTTEEFDCTDSECNENTTIQPCSEPETIIKTRHEDPNPCDTWGLCDQLCESLNSSSHSCSCTIGYQRVGGRCRRIKPGPEMVLYVGLKNRLIRIKNGKQEDLGRTAGLAGMDFHYEKRKIIWSDSVKKAIYSRDMDEDNLEERWPIPDTIVPGALAVDYVADNLYVIDANGDQIYVFDIETKNYTIVLTSYSNLYTSGIRDIVLDPTVGFMFLLDLTDQLYRVDMDGRQIKVLTDKVHPSSSLAIDAALKRVFVRSGSKKNLIEAISYDGKKVDSVFKGNPRKNEATTTALTSFELSLFWGDEAKETIVEINKFGAKENFTFYHLKENDQIVSLKAVHPAIQMHLKSINPCRDSTKCPQMCLLAPFLNRTLMKVCFCKVGADVTRWGDCSKREYLIFTQERTVRGEFLDGETNLSASVNPIKTTSASYVDVEIDVKRGHIYLADNSTKTTGIYRTSRYLEDKILFLRLNYDWISKMALDWVSDNLYYTDEINGMISLVNIQNQKFEKTLIEKLKKPKGIAVFPQKGYIFFSELNSNPARISKAFTDGSNIMDLKIPDLGEPTSLAVDIQEERLYWTDALHKHIRHSDLNGGNIEILESKLINVPHSIIIHESEIIVTDIENQIVVKMNKVNGSNEREIASTNNREQIHGLRMLSYKSQPEMYRTNPCETAACQKMCFLVPDGNDGLYSKCGCPRSESSRNTSRGSNYCAGSARGDHRKCSIIFGFCCDNNWQLNKKAKCDGVDNCLDGSDEANCDRRYVDYMFNCYENRISFVGRHKRCNGRKDCPEGSDEVNCDECPVGQFQCWIDGKCVPGSWTCDGEYDCLDMSDEGEVCKECPKENDFRCPKGNICLRREKVCNGIKDCPKAEDEANC